MKSTDVKTILNILSVLLVPFFSYTFRLLYSVLPPSVANELRHKRPVPAKRYDNVTILFSGIVGFNAFCSKHASGEGAMKIVNLLNDLYTRFDILTDSRRNPFVYKVSKRFSKYLICGFSIIYYHVTLSQPLDFRLF